MKRLFLTIICIIVGVLNIDANDSNFKSIRQLIEYIQVEPLLPLLQEPVYNRALLMDIYQSNEFEPVWEDLEYATIIVEELLNAGEYGLLPEDYHAELLLKLIQQDLGNQNPQFDVLLTDGLLLYSHHLLNGKLNPTDFFFSWNLPKRTIYQDSIRTFLKNTRREKVIEDLREHHPSFSLYRDLVNERKKWVEIKNKYDKKTVFPITKAIKPGDEAEIFPQLIQRLKDYGIVSVEISADLVYDSVYIPYIRKFQVLHGLEGDGVLGTQTLQAFNVTPEDRIRTIEVNMERLRWLSGGADEDMIFVNIAGFHLFFVKNGELVWDTSVMTGAVDTQTPVFASQMKYIVFNPNWTVPRGILQRSLFQKMKSDPGFLQVNNYSLFDSGGKLVDPSSIAWNEMSLQNFRYTVVQNPGPNNAMGVVKFMFPNQHAIYLHDTPSKSLFSKNSRAFSNGCIRVKDPLVLAEKILDDEKKYSMQKILEIVNSKNTQTVFLKDPINVLIVYLTADNNMLDNIVFRNDIYSRDKPVYDRLKKPLKTDYQLP